MMCWLRVSALPLPLTDGQWPTQHPTGCSHQLMHPHRRLPLRTLCSVKFLSKGCVQPFHFYQQPVGRWTLQQIRSDPPSKLQLNRTFFFAIERSMLNPISSASVCVIFTGYSASIADMVDVGRARVIISRASGALSQQPRTGWLAALQVEQ